MNRPTLPAASGRAAGRPGAPGACLLALLVLALAPGCAFRRDLTNPQFRALDTSAVKVGQSTWVDVLATLGPPTPANAEAIGQEAASLRLFRYPCTEVRTTSFTFPLYLILPFSWTDDALVADTVIEFDAQGVVSAIHQSGQVGIWRPFSGEEDRAPGWARTTDGGGP